MPGPVPSVSTKTRGYIQPPDFHTDRTNLFNTSAANAPYSPTRFSYPSETVSSTTYQNSYDTSSYEPAWKHALSNPADIYVPSYQKKVQANPTVQRQFTNVQPNQRTQQQYTTVTRQQQTYRPSSTQPTNLVHRQFNSPMSLYSNNNVQDLMKNHVSHITRVR
jgi:hypothetical protein